MQTFGLECCFSFISDLSGFSLRRTLPRSRYTIRSMTRFRVFLGAPTKRDIQVERDSNDYQPAVYHWVTSTYQLDGSPPHPGSGSGERKLLSPIEFELASQQIFKVYAGIMDSQRISDPRSWILDQSDKWDQSGMQRNCSANVCIDHIYDQLRTEGGSSLEGTEDRSKVVSLSYSDDSTPSMLRPTDSPATFPNRSVSVLRHDSVLSIMTDSLADSISTAVFPRFRFNFNDLSSLSKLLAEAEAGPTRRKRILKISFLAAVLEVDGPIAVQIKKGPEAGNVVSLLKLIIGDDGGTILRLTAWRNTADVMAGYDEAERPGIKRGDVVAFQSEACTCGNQFLCLSSS